VDQRITILLFFLNILYVALALWGAFRLRCSPALVPSSFSSSSIPFCVTAFPHHLETPNPATFWSASPASSPWPPALPTPSPFPRSQSAECGLSKELPGVGKQDGVAGDQLRDNGIRVAIEEDMNTRRGCS